MDIDLLKHTPKDREEQWTNTSIDLNLSLELDGRGNSNAILLGSFRKEDILVHLSGISGGTCTIEYSLSPKDRVEDDTAIWHSWGLGALSSKGGVVLGIPVSFIRVVTTLQTTSYKLEVAI